MKTEDIKYSCAVIVAFLMGLAHLACGQQKKETRETINGELITKFYEDNKLTLLTKGNYPYYYYEQYDLNGKLEIKSDTDKGIEMISHYRNGMVIYKERRGQ
jgi:hypothetical protein